MVANAPARADITPIWRAKWPAAVLVLGVAITWGASFPVVKSTVGEVSPPRLVGGRFVVATVTLLILRPRVLWELNRRTLTRGSVLGALLGIGFVLCTVGMQTTSVLISAFVIGTTVVLAPLIAWVWLGHRLTIRAASAVSLAFVGLAMITVRGFAVGPGTLLILAATVVWAAHLVALERWSRVDRLHGLTLVQLAASAAVALDCLLVFEDQIGEAFAIVEHPIEPHVIVEPHVHRDEDELSYVVAGTIWARVGEREAEALQAPRCGSHAESCTASGTRVRSRPGCSRSFPGGFERLFEDLQGSWSALLNLE